MKNSEIVGDVTIALWRLFSTRDSRSELSVEDVVKESGRSREDVDACFTQDEDLRKIISTGGFTKIMREELISA